MKRNFNEMFDSIELLGNEVTNVENIREAAKKFARVLEKNGVEGRELSLAFTKLEECTMWAIKSVGRESAEG